MTQAATWVWIVYTYQEVRDIIPDDLSPPTSDVVSLLGWLVAILLATLWWGVRTREREHRDNLKTWRDIAKHRGDALEAERTLHRKVLHSERERYEKMVKEVTEVITRSASVLESLREDLNEHNSQHDRWRTEVRETHAACLAEIQRLQGSVGTVAIRPRGSNRGHSGTEGDS